MRTNLPINCVAWPMPLVRSYNIAAVGILGILLYSSSASAQFDGMPEGTITVTGPHHLSAQRLIPSIDGGFFYIAQQAEHQDGCLIAKYDANGTTEWVRTIDSDEIISATEAPWGSLCLTFYLNTVQSGSNVACLDTAGRIEWNVELYYGKAIRSFPLFDPEEEGRGDVMVVAEASRDSVRNGTAPSFIRLRENGDTLYTVKVDLLRGVNELETIRTRDGDVIIISINNDSSGTMARFDPDTRTLEWVRHYRIKGSLVQLLGVVELPNGDLFLTGAQRTPIPGPGRETDDDVIVMRIDAAGNLRLALRHVLFADDDDIPDDFETMVSPRVVSADRVRAIVSTSRCQLVVTLDPRTGTILTRRHYEVSHYFNGYSELIPYNDRWIIVPKRQVSSPENSVIGMMMVDSIGDGGCHHCTLPSTESVLFTTPITIDVDSSYAFHSSPLVVTAPLFIRPDTVAFSIACLGTVVGTDDGPVSGVEPGSTRNDSSPLSVQTRRGDPFVIVLGVVPRLWSIEVHDLAGARIATLSPDENGPMSIVTIPTDNLPVGTYLIRLRSGTYEQTLRGVVR